MIVFMYWQGKILKGTIVNDDAFRYHVKWSEGTFGWYTDKDEVYDTAEECKCAKIQEILNLIPE